MRDDWPLPLVAGAGNIASFIANMYMPDLLSRKCETACEIRTILHPQREASGSGPPSVEVGIVGTATFESFVDPKILFGGAADILFDEPVDSNGIDRDIVGGEVFQHG